jgi:hypothetical protein
MIFTNPEILPTDRKAALERFQQIMRSQFVDYRKLLIVLGSTSRAAQLVNDAVTLTGKGNFQGVVWAKSPDIIRSEVDSLSLCLNVNRPNLDTPDMAFSMNIKSKIADVITDPEDQPDVARIMLAFASARPGCEDAES